MAVKLDLTTIILAFGGAGILYYLYSNKLPPFDKFDVDEILQGLKPKSRTDEPETEEEQGLKPLVLEDKFEKTQKNISQTFPNYPFDDSEPVQGGDPRLPNAVINNNLNELGNLFGYNFNSFYYDDQGNVVPIPLPTAQSKIEKCKNYCDTIYQGSQLAIDVCKKGCEIGYSSGHTKAIMSKLYKPQYELKDKFSIFGYDYNQDKNILQIKKFTSDPYNINSNISYRVSV